MRLEKIKLAGFKSFVDPTNVVLPSNLVGVVGPNGCGKSNIIDAVRWVMGESSAKHLRGESMADVIFSGSNSRKPVGSAVIELIFDNSDGAAGGEYAKYSQIAVKRQVSRDGQSNYFLNGTRCRRRDITDLFLGTGLGPRSYAIIEQGTISRLIEAKPEELRVFFEEAAGISKYKERRRETENRIRHTRENLDRLNDLREEVAKHLQHLQRQAKTAEKYKELKTTERKLRAELLALRRKRLSGELEQRDNHIRQQETTLEGALAEQRRLESELERQRHAHDEAGDLFHEVQGRYYGVGAEIARVEQAIQHGKAARLQLREDLESLSRDWEQARRHRAGDKESLEQISSALAEDEPRLEVTRAAEQEAIELRANAEQMMHDWQTAWDSFNAQASAPAQNAQVERTRITQLEKHLQHLQQRQDRIMAELDDLSESDAGEAVTVLEGRESAVQGELDGAGHKLSGIRAAIQEARDRVGELGTELDQARSRLQKLRGRHSSLEALQQAALGKQKNAVTQWLDQRGLGDAVRLAQRLDVEDGWQHAVETVLSFHLQAVCVDDLEPVTAGLDSLGGGTLTVFDTASVVDGSDYAAGGRLSSKVQAPWPLSGLLGMVHVADSMEEAVGMRRQLPDFESVITRDGVWMGNRWLRLTRDRDEHSGVLAREKELRHLTAEIEVAQSQLQGLETTLANQQARLRELEHAREDGQREVNRLHKALADVRAELGTQRARMEHVRSRAAHLRQESDDLLMQIESEGEHMEQARERLHRALEEMDVLAQRREVLEGERSDLRTRLDEARQNVNQNRQRAHELALKLEAMRSTRDSLVRALARAEEQITGLAAKREALQRQLSDSEAPLAAFQKELEGLLRRRVDVESELARVRGELERIEQSVRDLEQRRSGAEEAVAQERALLDQARLARQELVVRCSTLEEQLAEAGFELHALIECLPEGANEAGWEQDIEKLEGRIQRLGPINLAAIDEFEQQSERMNYLDAQHTDVSESLATLENAIRKIDRETRTRFKETFDKVNGGLQALFPKLFGGGHAYLELTGEDLLETGVTVMARPPGKRNSSIQLLSGGEKALTAVALVFSIFELNPAPFCLLDEVDAPLDDANVGRFCELLRSMSERVQFIFVTHNKVTMEIAHHLTGVTMHEPGVSRLVSVDVDEATQLVAL